MSQGKLRVVEGLIEVPCLLGEGVCRARGYMVVEVRNGRLCDALTGNRLVIEDGGELKGWGDLDGLSYNVRLAGFAGGANVPVRHMRRLVEQHGVILSKCME